MMQGNYTHPATLEHFGAVGALGRPFEEMAARIAKITYGEFAGAVVIIPPDGEPIAFLTTDPKPDLMQFWSAVKARVEIRAAEAVQSAAAAADPWGGRR